MSTLAAAGILAGCGYSKHELHTSTPRAAESRDISGGNVSEEDFSRIAEICHTDRLQYHGDRELIIFVPDIHTPDSIEETSAQVKALMQDVTVVGHQIGVIGLEGLEGHVDETLVQRIERDKNEYLRDRETFLDEQGINLERLWHSKLELLDSYAHAPGAEFVQYFQEERELLFGEERNGQYKRAVAISTHNDFEKVRDYYTRLTELYPNDPSAVNNIKQKIREVEKLLAFYRNYMAPEDTEDRGYLEFAISERSRQSVINLHGHLRQQNILVGVMIMGIDHTESVIKELNNQQASWIVYDTIKTARIR